MKHVYLISAVLLFLLFTGLPAYGQRQRVKILSYSPLHGVYFYRGSLNYNLRVGLAASRGDFCGRFHCNFLGRYLSMGLSYHIYPGLFIGADLEYFRLGAKERDLEGWWVQNTSFRGENMAITGFMHLNLRRDPRPFPETSREAPPVNIPYLKVGLGRLVFSNVTNEGRQPYSPEVKYVKSGYSSPDFALVVPFGVGISFFVSKELSVNPEIVYHITCSDYLDGRKAEGHKRPDHYGIASVKIQYTPAKTRIRRNMF